MQALQPTQRTSFGEAAGAGLRRQLRIGDQRARHAHRLGAAVGDQAVRRPPGRRCARWRCAAELSGEMPRVLGDRVLGDRRRRHDPDRAEVGRRVAERQRDVVDALGSRAVRRSRPCAASRPRAGRRRRARRCLRAPRGVTAVRKRRAVTPLVVALVQRRVEELLDQVAVRRRDLDAVETGCRRQLGARARSPSMISSISAAVSARGSTRKRGLGTAEGASAGARGARPDLLAAAVQAAARTAASRAAGRRRRRACSRRRSRAGSRRACAA